MCPAGRRFTNTEARHARNDGLSGCWTRGQAKAVLPSFAEGPVCVLRGEGLRKLPGKRLMFLAVCEPQHLRMSLDSSARSHQTALSILDSPIPPVPAHTCGPRACGMLGRAALARLTGARAPWPAPRLKWRGHQVEREGLPGPLCKVHGHAAAFPATRKAGAEVRPVPADALTFASLMGEGPGSNQLEGTACMSGRPTSAG